jgi:predicted nucleic acid-binding protein
LTYLLDTNVVTELRRPRTDRGVVAWVETTTRETTYVSVLVLGEIRQGIERLRRRDPSQALSLERWLVSLEEVFSDRVLAIDEPIAHAWGRLSAADTLPPIDGLLAATALVHGLTVVTRDTGPFERIGVPYLDPWAYGNP